MITSIRNETLQFLEKASKNFSNLNSEELNQIELSLIGEEQSKVFQYGIF